MTNNDIKILITGDFCPINRIEKLARNQDYGSIFNDFIGVFRDNDLNIIDLECPLTLTSSARLKYGPHQKAHPDCVKILKYAGIHLAALANNHIMDYGPKGVIDTLDLCQSNGIETFGIGNTPDEARKPFSKAIQGKNIAIFNFADDEFISTPEKSFFCNPALTEQMLNAIIQAKNNHDFIIVIIHGGNEFYELPSPRIKSLYRILVDLGADAIISHHTHAFSGYEIYKSKPIFYGLGNFIYDWPGKTNAGWSDGFVVRLILSDMIDFELIPLKQGGNDPGVFHLDDAQTNNFLNEINRLNSIINNDTRLEIEFQKYCDSVFPMYNAFIEPNFGKYIAFLRKRRLFPNFLSRRKRLLLLNIIRCESHRDVLIRMLRRYE